MNVFHRSSLVLTFVFTLAASSARGAVSPVPAKADKDRAVAILEQSVKSDPNNSELWLHLGFAYRKLEKINEAQSAFEKAAALNPQGTEAFYMLGLIYESKNQTQAAQEAWKKYLAAETNLEKRAVAEKHLHHLNP